MISKEMIGLGVQKAVWPSVCKSELMLNKVYDNNDFNVITNNETLAIEPERSDKITLTLATIYCPDGKPDRYRSRAVTSLSDKVILIVDFNSKHNVFNCATTATSGRYK